MEIGYTLERIQFMGMTIWHIIVFFVFYVDF